MEYQVLARKYRPQTFTDVVGQEIIARTLTNAIRLKKVAHAYLFTGPRGVGKTSMARILAKALTCESGPTTEPCGVCGQCRQITESSHPDVREIDAARINGVDNIRQLAEDAVLSPSMAGRRIFILDEVHMLSNSAWNALLKLIEEPPPHVNFVFCTTEAEDVPDTVKSRCWRFDFRPLAGEPTARRLAEIAQKEGRPLPEALLYRIARAAGGGMRDAQTLLDQLLAVSEGEPSEEDLILLLGAARSGEIDELMHALIDGRAAAALESLDRSLAGGAAPSTLLDQLVDHVRAMLLTQACGADAPAVRRLGVADVRVGEHAKACPPERTLRVCQILIGSQQAIRQGVDPRLQLELTCVRIAGTAQMVDLDRLVQRLERLEASGHPR